MVSPDLGADSSVDHYGVNIHRLGSSDDRRSGAKRLRSYRIVAISGVFVHCSVDNPRSTFYGENAS
jgi:hypothetical protein